MASKTVPGRRMKTESGGLGFWNQPSCPKANDRLCRIQSVRVYPHYPIPETIQEQPKAVRSHVTRRRGRRKLGRQLLSWINQKIDQEFIDEMQLNAITMPATGYIGFPPR
jgi:hypothetical protein